MPENIETDEIKKPNLYTCFDVIEKKNNEEAEESIEIPKTKVLKNYANKYQGMSQIEKFNMKYSQ